nr:uncharacterized protein LOC112030147 [Quercus suber]
MHQLMRRIEEHKRLEDDRLQDKGKAPAFSQYNRNFQLERYQQKAKRERRVPSLNLAPRPEGVNVTFKEPVYKILECIKNKLYFRWPRKMGGDPAKRNQSLYYTYHREKGHTTKRCRMLKNHLEQLVKAGHLKEFVFGQGGANASQGLKSRGNTLPPPLEIIEVIHAASIGVSMSHWKGILNVATLFEAEVVDRPEKRLRVSRDLITFD